MERTCSCEGPVLSLEPVHDAVASPAFWASSQAHPRAAARAFLELTRRRCSRAVELRVQRATPRGACASCAIVKSATRARSRPRTRAKRAVNSAAMKKVQSDPNATRRAWKGAREAASAALTCLWFGNLGQISAGFPPVWSSPSFGLPLAQRFSIVYGGFHRGLSALLRPTARRKGNSTPCGSVLRALQAGRSGRPGSRAPASDEERRG
jgi:hypothetical protein